MRMVFLFNIRDFISHTDSVFSYNSYNTLVVWCENNLPKNDWSLDYTSTISVNNTILPEFIRIENIKSARILCDH